MLKIIVGWLDACACKRRDTAARKAAFLAWREQQSQEVLSLLSSQPGRVYTVGAGPMKDEADIEQKVEAIRRGFDLLPEPRANGDGVNSGFRSVPGYRIVGSMGDVRPLYFGNHQLEDQGPIWVAGYLSNPHQPLDEASYRSGLMFLARQCFLLWIRANLKRARAFLCKPAREV